MKGVLEDLVIGILIPVFFAGFLFPVSVMGRVISIFSLFSYCCNALTQLLRIAQTGLE